MKMPTEKMDTAMFAPCGMNCLVCYKHCYQRAFVKGKFIKIGFTYAGKQIPA